MEYALLLFCYNDLTTREDDLLVLCLALGILILQHSRSITPMLPCADGECRDKRGQGCLMTSGKSPRAKEMWIARCGYGLLQTYGRASSSITD